MIRVEGEDTGLPTGLSKEQLAEIAKIKEYMAQQLRELERDMEGSADGVQDGARDAGSNIENDG